MPSDEDILLCRIPTKDVSEVRLLQGYVIWRIFDTGGQRSERRNWILCFEEVNAILFVAATSHYDQVMSDENKTNKLVESIQITCVHI